MNKRKKCILSGGGVVVAAMLLVNPKLTNPPSEAAREFFASNAPPAEIAATLRNACFDCHSHETRWPWYSHIAPVSWWLVDHVNDGRRHLNFSRWPYDDPQRAAKWLQHIGDSVDEGDMPLPGYDYMHPAARLSAGQRDALVKWAQAEAAKVRGPDEATNAH